MPILFFTLLTLFFVCYFIIFMKQSMQFVMSLSFMDGIQYILHIIFCIGCTLLIFQPIKLPFLWEYSFIFKLILLIPVLCLLAVPSTLRAIGNPNDEFRVEIIRSQKEREELTLLLENSKEFLADLEKWQERYSEILTRCENKMKELEEADLSEEEKEEKVKEIWAECDKEIEKLNEGNNKI